MRVARRTLMAMGGGLAAAGLLPRAALSAAHPLSPDADPLTAADQQMLERRMARIVRLEPVQEAKRRVAAAWLAGLARPPVGEERRRFDQAVDEMAGAAAMNLLNRDPLRPMIHHVELPPHRVGDLLVPGTRYAIDNPDTLYRTIPVDGRSHYVLEGLGPAHGPAVTDFSLMDQRLVTLASLPGDALKVARARRFTITLGPEPAAGRPNHLQTTPAAWQLFIRDTLGDWRVERPTLLAVRRVEPAEPAPPPDDGEMASRVAAALDGYLADNLRFIAMAGGGPGDGGANRFSAPGFAADNGRLVSQSYSFGRFRVAADEALVLTVDPAGARYATVPLTSLYGTTGDPAGRLASLNNRQADLSPDGRFTVVVAQADPGVYNWLDTEGLAEGLVFARWAGFAALAGPPPPMDVKLVKLRDLEGALPPGMRRVDAAGRAAQLAERARAYAARTRGA